MMRLEDAIFKAQYIRSIAADVRGVGRMMRVCMVRRYGCAVDDAWRTCADDVWHVYVRCDVTDDVWFSACVV